MSILDLAKFAEVPLSRHPYDHIVVPALIDPADVARIVASFPKIADGGLYPLSELTYGSAFAELIGEIRAPALTEAFATKFGLDLSGRPLMVTVRGLCQQKDGRIHNDSESKVISALIYLNDRWDEDGGRFRILNGPDNIDDFAAEVPPQGGTLAAFRRSENSFHGHRPFVGVRRYVMLNWMADEAALAHELARHRLSAQVKRIGRRLWSRAAGRARA
jgi:hypothetical protein